MKKFWRWIIEFFVWLVVITLITFIAFFVHSHHIKDNYTTHVFMQDADGLIVGSPVRMMGVQVGYVSFIKVINDELYISFVITDKGTTIPVGSLVSVEFNGLGGSKSLEIYAPTEDSKQSRQAIVVKPTMRLQNFLEVQSNIANSTITLATNISDTFTNRNISQLKKLLKENKDGEKAYNIIDSIDKFQDSALDYINNRIKRKNGKSK